MKFLFKYFEGYKVPAILAPLFKLFEALLELLIPLIVAYITDVGIANNDSSFIVKMVLLMILLGFIGLGFSIAGQYFSAKAAIGVVTKLRKDLFNKVQNLSYSDIDTLGTSSIITRMTSDINQIQTGINLTLRLFLRSPIVVFGAAIMAFRIDVKAGLIFVIAIPILALIIFGIMLITMPMHKKVQTNLDDVLGQTRENLTGVRVIRAFGREQEEIEEYDERLNTLERSQNKVGNISNLLNPLTYIIINIGIILVLFIGAKEVDSGVILQGSVIALTNYMSQILVELIKLANLIITMTKSAACLSRVKKIMDMDTTVNYTNEEVNENLPFIKFDHVSFTYKNAGGPSLSDIDFNVSKGSMVGIIGGTGSGKSTLINLLMRNYDVTEGTLYYDGTNINNYTKQDLRAKTGYVLQKAVLFKGTIRDNLRFANPLATDEEIMEACDIAQCTEVIKKKEGGLDSFVEQNGKNFSGGQRQRLCIARALVNKPEMIILDDSSSALDYKTDAELRLSLRKLEYKPTIFIISQRTASIQNADQIIVLDDGKIAGIGKHDDLLKSCTVYQEIYASQFKKEAKDHE